MYYKSIYENWMKRSSFCLACMCTAAPLLKKIGRCSCCSCMLTHVLEIFGKTQGKMVRLIVITTVLSVFILLLYIPYAPSKDLNYNQGVETRRIIEQPSSTENNPALYALERLHFNFCVRQYNFECIHLFH